MKSKEEQIPLFSGLPDLEKDQIKNPKLSLHCGCMFKLFDEIESNSIDFLIADLPYNTTACSWESAIDLELFWKHVKRVVKRENHCVALFASPPFTYQVYNSNPKGYRYQWIWNKRFGANFVQAKRMPLKTTEDILIFSTGKKLPRYFPVMEKRKTPISQGRQGKKENAAIPIRGKALKKSNVYTEKFPSSILTYCAREEADRFHPTQKPVALFKYLIKTYTKEGERVLDPCFGSGPSILGCLNLTREIIGFEREVDYFAKTKKRLQRKGVNCFNNLRKK